MSGLTRRVAVTAAAGMLLLAGCSDGSTVDDTVAGAQGGARTPVTAGYVSAIDQIGMSAGLEAGFFDTQNLDVKLSQPFPTGVDAINALQSGEVDFVQVGTPSIAAAQKGVDLVLVGNYTGSASQRSIDDTMALIAKGNSGIDGADPKTLRGKRIGVSIGSINHLYLIGLLRGAGLSTKDVELVNTEPPDMPVALQTGGIDAAAVWDPWPIVMTEQVAGAREVLRGGGNTPMIGYIITTRNFARENPEVVQRFLAARAETDQWMRKNPDKAADSATRWLPGTKLAVAKESMRNNTAQLDPRFSACNYLALDTIASTLAEQGSVQSGFNVGRYLEPAPLLRVMRERPELFADLPAIPQQAVIDGDYDFQRDAAMRACPA